ncbi:serine acetyltransferase [Alkalithermobacter paradoxus]|uniref:Serine acetyltransferase n=1 Tax=Alkalithermobacter paradoxus TaxID=29349 RepID=A0A1V4I4U5_9FIRM|nr:serine acetyltransferase [[Clostridium] thermoalcaliphilum]
MRIMDDINTIKKNDPAARNTLEIILNYPGLHAIIMHRIAHFLFTYFYSSS